MRTLLDQLQQAVLAALAPEHRSVDPLVQPARDEKFGDYQSNLAMSLAKSLGVKPRDLAQSIAERLGSHPALERVEVAGPGFLNLTLSDAFLLQQATALAADPRAGVDPAPHPLRVVVDYASPNLAKEMHVGHLRSTIIGDAIARVLDFHGHDVIAQNHVGDWGTQFGMLLQHLIELGWTGGRAESIRDLNDLYQQAKRRDDADAEFARQARLRVVELQAGDTRAMAIWQQLIGESVRHMNEVFHRLGVRLTDEHLRPESFYNDQLAGVCEELASRGIAELSDEALCIFVPGHEQPLMIRKRDGGYGYGTTDLAALRYRVRELGAQRLIYVVDARQREHFQLVFAAAARADYAPAQVELVHVGFGTILGRDNKPFKTREGGTVRLTDVLDEAQRRAESILMEKSPELPEEERQRIARAISVGAVKYADLSSDRIKDYVFDYDRMLAFDGNTAPYLQNAYVRVMAIFRKGGIDPAALSPASLRLTDPAERRLAIKLLQFADTLVAVERSLEPHRLCTYLYEAATLYHRFYESCPVLTAADEATRAGRLVLCRMTAATLRQGMDLLGIETVDRM